MMVRMRGLEPPRPCERQYLKLVRLPIPPHPDTFAPIVQRNLLKSCTRNYLNLRHDLPYHRDMDDAHINLNLVASGAASVSTANPGGNSLPDGANSPQSQFESAQKLHIVADILDGDTDPGYVILLSRGAVALVSAVDYERVSLHKWSVVNSQHGLYAGRTIRGNRKVFLHRFVMDAPADVWVDHARGNTLDCRRSQLRFATPSQNSANRSPSKNGSSRYLGVHARPNGRWIAKIRLDGKQQFLGSYATELEAAARYNEVAPRIHGEFARLNDIPAGIVPVRLNQQMGPDAVAAIIAAKSDNRRSAQQIANQYGISSQHVRRIWNGKHHTAIQETA